MGFYISVRPSWRFEFKWYMSVGRKHNKDFSASVVLLYFGPFMYFWGFVVSSYVCYGYVVLL